MEEVMKSNLDFFAKNTRHKRDNSPRVRNLIKTVQNEDVDDNGYK